mmetsp:Transcript_14004/g.29516  ORF Transcript_14004/g.29516 Transcript_14004/m.29516 type:complete len:104 (+) Transcript_14004:289-600(+)
MQTSDRVQNSRTFGINDDFKIRNGPISNFLRKKIVRNLLRSLLWRDSFVLAFISNAYVTMVLGTFRSKNFTGIIPNLEKVWFDRQNDSKIAVLHTSVSIVEMN